MQTLLQLRSGKLKGVKRLKLSESLDSFPMEILDLADSLEILDLSNNNLSIIPKEIEQLRKLKIAFFSNNLFTSVPDAFKGCENLYMLGLKANQIEFFKEDILPLSISWLILTDNKLKKLPDSMGKLTKLQKFPIAGNKLEELPSSLSKCKNLELIRLSANNFKVFPSLLLELPRLAWMAFSGNPCVETPSCDTQKIDYEDLEIQEQLGEGASGEIFKAYSKSLKTTVAVKFFKGAVTSDGFAEDEMNACLAVEKHENLIKVIAKIQGHTKQGLLLEYITQDFKNLGNPPNFDTCTRDTYEDKKVFTLNDILTIAKSIASVAQHLHAKNLMHGDLYAHNILINDANKCYLGDFGAASFYDGENERFEKIEVRAFGCLLEDMLLLSHKDDGTEYKKLVQLKDRCLTHDISTRPLFKEMGL